MKDNASFPNEDVLKSHTKDIQDYQGVNMGVLEKALNFNSLRVYWDQHNTEVSSDPDSRIVRSFDRDNKTWIHADVLTIQQIDILILRKTFSCL